jgi:ATPase subunit of ABC transporter with duplicated ATPase domains
LGRSGIDVQPNVFHNRIVIISAHHATLRRDPQVWPDTPETEFRKYLGRFGLSGQLATMPMKNLSGGQKSRACFAEMSLRHPHIMLFDEPTNVCGRRLAFGCSL